MKKRTILHADLNNFYASVECFNHPELRGHPVAVCGSAEERHGIVLAKNYQAKAFGVTTGEAIWQAKQKCKDLVVVPPTYEQYMKFSRLTKAIYSRYTDLIEPMGMDECWLDVTGSTSIFGDGRKIADELRETVKFELGLTISVGVSFNKVFAKLGSDMKKPDATTEIPYESFREVIWGLPASDLLGVGRATMRKLVSCGIHTIGQLAQYPEEYLSYKLGKWGTYLWLFANGMDTSPVTTREIEVLDKSAGHGITTLQDLENAAEVWPVMLELTQEIGHRLYMFRKQCRGIAIDIRDNRLMGQQWQCKLPVPTQSASVIAENAFDLFSRSYAWRNPIRSVTVRAIDLISEDTPCQYGLFFDAERARRIEARDRAVDEIRYRYGKHSIRNAVLLSPNKLPPHDNPEVIMPHGIGTS